jgi:hypothetical protein
VFESILLPHLANFGLTQAANFGNAVLNFRFAKHGNAGHTGRLILV